MEEEKEWLTELLHEALCKAWGSGGSIKCKDCPDKKHCDWLEELLKKQEIQRGREVIQ